MTIVGIESASMVASVAILNEEGIVAEYTVNHKKTHSQTLLPMLDEIATMTELDWERVDAIAVSEGPGSFTGLRIGSSTAKGLGLALKLPLVSVPTLDAMAYSLNGVSGLVCPMLDARRNQVYTGLYRVEDALVPVKTSCAMAVEELIEEINQLGEPITFLGDGLNVSLKQIQKQCRVSWRVAPPHRNRQTAAAVAALGLCYYKEGRCVTAAEHAPQYLRPSQAERVRQERLQEQSGSEGA